EQDGLIGAAGLFHRHLVLLAVFQPHQHFVLLQKDIAVAVEKPQADLPADAVGAHHLGERDPGVRLQSTISRGARRPSLVDTAVRIVRMDWAVRPSLPMTFPMSSLATRSSMRLLCSPAISVTTT